MSRSLCSQCGVARPGCRKQGCPWLSAGGAAGLEVAALGENTGREEPAFRLSPTGGAAKAASAGRQLRCVGCGCTESRACAGGCWWLVSSTQSRSGVCSNCEDQLPAWLAGGGAEQATPR